MTNMAALLLKVLKVHKEVTVVSLSVSRQMSSPSCDKRLWIAKVSNGYVCDICQKFELAGSEIKKNMDDKTVSTICKPKTIR